MERLKEANYPCTMLVSHYRSHPEIMDFFSRAFYNNSLKHMSSAGYISGVGYEWHEFTRGDPGTS